MKELHWWAVIYFEPSTEWGPKYTYILGFTVSVLHYYFQWVRNVFILFGSDEIRSCEMRTLKRYLNKAVYNWIKNRMQKPSLQNRKPVSKANNFKSRIWKQLCQGTIAWQAAATNVLALVTFQTNKCVSKNIRSN